MAPEIQNMQVELGSAEIYFAKKLANNDKKIRDRTLKKLKSWLKSKGTSEEGNNLIFWGGVHKFYEDHRFYQLSIPAPGYIKLTKKQKK